VIVETLPGRARADIRTGSVIAGRLPRVMPARGRSEEFRGTSGHKKSGRPRLFGLPQAGVLLEKWELLLPKNFGDVRLLPWGMFPGSRRCCEAAPDSAGKMS